MKKILSVLLFLGICSFSFGQQTFQDVVYLKNGGILRGRILEKFPDQSIKFENSDEYSEMVPVRWTVLKRT